MTINASDSSSANPPTKVSWLLLPRKSQLLILFLCRLSDFTQVASLQSYVFPQLRYNAPAAPDATISWQAGVIHATFSSVQVITAVLWGHLADLRWMGRKNVLVIGLVGTGVSCLGLAFSTNFVSMLMCRLAGGAVNGTVGVV